MTLFIWSFCAGGRRFAPRPWGSFSSNQATCEVFSTEHAIYSKFIRINLRGEAVNYRPFASPSFKVASYVKTAIIIY